MNTNTNTETKTLILNAIDRIESELRPGDPWSAVYETTFVLEFQLDSLADHPLVSRLSEVVAELERSDDILEFARDLLQIRKDAEAL